VGHPHIRPGFLVIAIAECAPEAAPRYIRTVRAGLFVGAVHVSEHLAALFLLGVVVAGLVVEHAVRLVPEEAEVEQIGHNAFVS